MRIDETKHGAVTVLKPKGPLGVDDAEAFKQRALETLGMTLGRFVLDVSEVPFADSAGLEALADVGQELIESGQTLKLCAETETLREVLELTDLSGLFEHYQDVSVAVRSFL
jgi:anti-anti-sigma factor